MPWRSPTSSTRRFGSSARSRCQRARCARARGDSLKPNSPSESVYVWMTLLKSGKSAVVCVQHSLAAFVRGLSLRGVP